MKKRLLSLLMALILGLGTVPLSACGSKETIKRGDLLTMICDSFGMVSYTQEEPYLASVGEDSPYFGPVQACVEWGIVDPEEQDYDLEAAVTRGELALAVVNATGMAEGSSDEEKVALAASQGFVEAKSDGTVKENTKVTPQEAADAVAAACNMWLNQTYDTPVEEIGYVDGVQDLTEELTDYRVEGNVTYIPVSSGVDIQPGDVYVLGPQNPGETADAQKAESVEVVDGYYVITNSTDELTMEEVLGEYKNQATITPDFLNDCQIFGPDGQPVTLVASDSSASASAEARQLGVFQSGSLEFTAPDGSEISVSIKSSSFTVSYKKPIKLKEPLKDCLSGEGSITVSNVKVTTDVDFGWLAKLKKASVKLDYQTTITGGVSLKAKIPDLILAPYSNRNGGFLSNLKNSSLKWDTDDMKGATEIKICTIKLAGGKLAGLSLEVKLKIGLSGSAELSITMAGSRGIEYKNGNLRYIKSNNTDWDFNVKGKLEITPYIGLKLNVLKFNVFSGGVSGGVGFELEFIAHVVDSENHLLEQVDCELIGDLTDSIENASMTTSASVISEIAESQGGVYAASDEEVQLHMDICCDLAAYGILKIEVEDECLVGKLAKGKVKLSVEFFNKDNATFAHWHIEDWQNVGECTRKYTPFDEGDADAADEENQEEGKEQQGSTVLDLAAYTLSLPQGQQATLEFTAMPDGAALNDLEFTSSDTAVATVDSQGVVTAVAAGSATVTATLKSDTSVTVQCVVFVNG